MDTFLKFILFAVISYIVAIFVSKVGLKIGLDDKPSERSSHIKTTPKGGGLGILLVFIISSIYLKIDYNFSLPVIFISLLSLYGDSVHISPKVRLLFHFMAAFVIISGLSFNENIIINSLFFISSVIFIAGTANFYNFMDGIDGIAAITGIVAFISMYTYLSLYYPESPFRDFSLFIGAACIGFLPANFPRAKVFMGDVGSMLLGITFSSLVVITSNSLTDFICMSGFLFTFYLDELVTMLSRIKNGDNLGKPHRNHLYQLLVNELKFDHYKISIFYGIFQILVSLSLIYLRNKSILMIIGFYIISLFLFVSFYYFVKRKVLFRFSR